MLERRTSPRVDTFKRGKIMFSRPAKSHLLGGKTRKRKRQLRGSIQLQSKSLARQIASKLA